VLRNEHGSLFSISPKTPLPYVSGAIIDDCGYLAGVSVTSGPQSLDTVKSTLSLLGSELSRALDEMQVTLPAANCDPAAQAAKATGVPPVQQEESADTAKTRGPEPETARINPVEPEVPAPAVDETATAPSQGAVDVQHQQQTTSSSEPPSIWGSVPLWLPLLALIILAVFTWKVLFFFRLKHGKSERVDSAKIAQHVQPASDEPATAPLETGPDSGLSRPRSAPVFNFEIPELNDRPDGCDGALVIDGTLDANTGFKRFCFINTQKISVIIGRGDADINIEHVAISRAHARVESDGELISLTDLGSRNGTFVGDVPCLRGEIMYVQADDEIYLGQVKLRIRVARQEAEWA